MTMTLPIELINIIATFVEEKDSLKMFPNEYKEIKDRGIELREILDEREKFENDLLRKHRLMISTLIYGFPEPIEDDTEEIVVELDLHTEEIVDNGAKFYIVITSGADSELSLEEIGRGYCEMWDLIDVNLNEKLYDPHWRNK